MGRGMPRREDVGGSDHAATDQSRRHHGLARNRASSRQRSREPGSQTADAGQKRDGGKTGVGSDILFPQPPAGPKEQRLDRRLADVEAPRDLGVAQPLDFPKKKSPLMTLCEAAQRLHDVLPLLTCLEAFLGAGAVQPSRNVFVVRQTADSLPAAERIGREIARDPEQPPAKRRTRLQGVGAIHGTNQALLTDILCILPVRGETAAESEKVGCVTAQQGLESPIVPLFEAQNELCVGEVGRDLVFGSNVHSPTRFPVPAEHEAARSSHHRSRCRAACQALKST